MRVDHALALDALQPGLDAPPSAGVDHHRHPGDLGIARPARSGTSPMAADASSMASSMFTSTIWAPPRTCWRPTSRASSSLLLADQAGETCGCRPRWCARRRSRTGTPRRCAAARGRPGRCPARARAPGAAACPSTASAMAAMYSGVVPQQPPTMFSSPASANSPRMAGHLLGGLVVAAQLVGQAGVGMGRNQGVGAARRSPPRRAAWPWRPGRSSGRRPPGRRGAGRSRRPRASGRSGCGRWRR